MQFIDFPKIDFGVMGIDEIKLPKMYKIKQKYADDKIDDIDAWIFEQMEKTIQDKQSYKGKRICITAGSRGIPNLDKIILSIIKNLKNWGAEPFVIPSMGSHGGGSVEGQLEILRGYNITEESMGVPILATMEVVQVGELPDGTEVYCDKYAYEADGIVLLNKVKPHTDFRGKNESGMAKMMAIGIANHKGAAMFHRMGFQSFAERIPQVCDVFLKNTKVAFGVGIVQNAYDDISEIEIVNKENFLERDAALLEIAKSRIATFKDPNIDLLIIDEIGKNISGNGHDPNITGRSNSPGFESILNLKKLFIRGLTEETHHNGCGINQADMTTRRCLKDIDFSTMWTNVATTNNFKSGRIPMYAETDKDAIKMCIRTCIGINYNKPRVVRILNTSSMNEIEVSEGYLEIIKDRDDIEIISGPYELNFDNKGFLE